ncbi:hypothetical protein D8B22_20500 [Verminephrobacter aporrectodeae subsp. tuberculatae]|uniref:hypothetical protein n=1 Tax=Verminephrobacter aporrectodeae TaxID=1110389 RepID=UPI002244490C|nr:hypothetical protein [Verminephrobacter aporrectodeae]MCW8164619.1 hypothetical protein [Verminephrobacter aporrectodeae subsp. tuberculatae]MCW8171417.1 hypothetical protein [Verminephrobacter aporrectodeae subsp. tuberculatae]
MTLTHNTITPIPSDGPNTLTTLWNSRYQEIDANFAYLENEIAAAQLGDSSLCNTIGTMARKLNNVSRTLNSVGTRFVQIVGIVCTATGGGAGTWQHIDANYNAINTTGETFNKHPTYAGVIDETIDGQAMVRVPLFYMKTGTVPRGDYVGKRYWMVSDLPVPGFSVHPAFMHAGVEIDQYWVGKYQGTADGDSKLGSVANVLPLQSSDDPVHRLVFFEDMRALANARNTAGVTGFCMWNIYQLAAIQTLALIEMGGSDSQSLIGQGHVSSPTTLVTDHETVKRAAWRGIVGLWGNLGQMIDGLKTNADAQYMIWDKNGNQTYESTSKTAPANGYPVQMATDSAERYDLGLVFVAGATNLAYDQGTYGDYFKQAPNSVTYYGGSRESVSGNHVGLFSLEINWHAEYGHSHIGSRLAKV